MNYNNDHEGPKLDLKLNLSPPIDHRYRKVVSPEISPRSSCLSREESPDGAALRWQSGSFPEANSMMLVGCPRCLMYVMLIFEEDLKCPKCKSTVLLDFLHDRNRRGLKK